MALSGLNVVVIGAGIGGAAAALALARRGAQVRVMEQADRLEEVGAGLQISTNAQHVLRALDVVHGAPDGAVLSSGTLVRDAARGRRVTTLPAPRAGPTWYMHRADLLDLIVQAARAAGVEFALGHLMRPGDAIAADLIVAADGARSLWRGVIDAPAPPVFTGQVAWRALVPLSSGVQTRHADLTMGPGGHIVSYPLRNGSMMNIAAFEDRRDWREEGWDLTADPGDMRARFAAFGGPVAPLLERVEDVHLWALHLRAVARIWWRDNTVLLGDAAHPTLPYMAQGACLALEDAWVLAASLVHAPDVAAGLSAYQSARQNRARRIVALAKGNAWRFHLAKPFAWGAQAVLAAGGGLLARRLDWIYDCDVTALDVQIDPNGHMV